MMSGNSEIIRSTIGPIGGIAGVTKTSKTQPSAKSRIAPSNEIQRASVNFAFSGPDTILPATQRTSDPAIQKIRKGTTYINKISINSIAHTPLV